MTTKPAPRTGHPYYMHDAVHGQPSAIARVLTEERASVEAAARLLGSARRIHLVGIGTSWHAALIGEYLLRTVAGREDARAWNSFEFAVDGPALDSGDAVVVLTHTGRKCYSVQALEMAGSAGAATVLVTGIDSVANTGLAGVVVRTSSQDRSSAYTISHTTALTALAMLARELGRAAGRDPDGEVQREIEELPSLMSRALGMEPEIKRWAESVPDVETFHFVGWGPNVASAYEAGLKMKETSYVASEGFQLEHYLHGPFCAAEPGVALTLIAPNGNGLERAAVVAAAADTVGARTAAIAPEGGSEVARLVKTTTAMPHVSEPLTPIVYLVPLQLFTYWVAVSRGRQPDAFRLNEAPHKAAYDQYRL